MGCKPELAALRKLQKFNTLRLLEMQSQLVQQAEDYEYLCSLDAKVHCPITQSYSTNWETLDEAQGLSGSLQRDAWRKLRDGLEPYCKSTYSNLISHERSLTFPKTTHCYST